jgi:hypothetical protein
MWKESAVISTNVMIWRCVAVAGPAGGRTSLCAVKGVDLQMLSHGAYLPYQFRSPRASALGLLLPGQESVWAVGPSVATSVLTD